MRSERTDSFKTDYNKLTPAERELFRSAVKEFNAACDQFVVRREWSIFPNALRSLLGKPQQGQLMDAELGLQRPQGA